MKALRPLSAGEHWQDQDDPFRNITAELSVLMPCRDGAAVVRYRVQRCHKGFQCFGAPTGVLPDMERNVVSKIH